MRGRSHYKGKLTLRHPIEMTRDGFKIVDPYLSARVMVGCGGDLKKLTAYLDDFFSVKR